MSKKIEREFRDQLLTPNEAARDAENRKKIQQEFPASPSVDQNPPLTANGSSTLSEVLKRSIRASGKTIESIAIEAGVSPALLAQYLGGERDIRLSTADKLAGVLHLEISPN